jgi:hypothetical protein
MDWLSLDQPALMKKFQEIGQRIRKGELEIGRHHYALSLAHGVMQAIMCGYHRISAVELGVAHGGGLFDLCKAAAFFRDECQIDIQVWGIDNAAGLPPLTSYKDHPEIWHPEQFKMQSPDKITEKLPAFAHLLIGDVGDMVQQFFHESYGSRLGFVSIDLDYYSSTKRALPLLAGDPNAYIPIVPVYVDDVNVLLSYNTWCGEAAAIAEFNQQQEFRKIEPKPNFRIHNFHVCHVFDHPIRSGAIKPRLPFEIRSI